jgi:hypothetical protein
LAAVDVVENAVVPFATATTLEVIATIAVAPPPPGFVVVRNELFGFTTTTLPTAPTADSFAAAMAAVDKSPATAANED